MSKKIIVGFDGNEGGRDALALGEVLARAEGADLIAACFYESLALPPIGSYEGWEHELREMALRTLEQAKAQCRGKLDTHALASESPVRGLHQFAEQEDADLIVVGTSHRGKVSQALAGLVAEGLLHGSPCAVAVAPKDFRDRGGELALIGVGYDGRPEAENALDAAIELAKGSGATLRLIAVATASPLVEPLQEVLDEGVSRASLEVDASGKLAGGPAIRLLDEHDLDLLVVGSRGYGPVRRVLLGSVSGEVVRDPALPVMVVPRGAEVRAPAAVNRVAPVSDAEATDGLISVVLADDHVVVRSGLRMLLESEADMEVVAEAGDAESAARYVLGHKPSALVLDLNMPGEPSLEVIPKLSDSSPNTVIVVLTMQNEPAAARAALRAGARGYVLKHAAGTELVEAIRTAVDGGTYLNPALGARVAAEPPAPSGPPDQLTEREVEVLKLIALGHTNNEIAGQLFLSVRTVETHRAHIQQKLSLSTRAELVRYALDHDLVDR
jgi:two-component system response regulator NreC